jgi:hypothetical protein
MQKAKFKRGMLALTGAYQREVDEVTTQLYWRVLGEILTDEEWDKAVEACVSNETYWPTPSVLLDYSKPNRKAIVKAENGIKAQDTYDAIVSLFEDGERVTGAGVEKAHGFAAKAAFAAAGGPRAFAFCEPRNEPFRRKAFVEEFRRLADADPLTLRPKEQKALPDGWSVEIQSGKPTVEERVVTLRKQVEADA